MTQTPPSSAADLNDAQREALALAAGRKTGLISCGPGAGASAWRGSPRTLEALARRGLMSFVGKGGPYYALWVQYRITDAGRALAATLTEAKE